MTDKKETVSTRCLCTKVHLRQVERLFREGRIIERAEAYVAQCQEAGSQKGGGCFPNLAGLGRLLGVGLSELERLGDKYPVAYDAVLAVLEDGALNAGCIPADSAMLTVDYFRHRVWSGGREEGTAQGLAAPTVIFEHDIEEDGK